MPQTSCYACQIPLHQAGWLQCGRSERVARYSKATSCRPGFQGRGNSPGACTSPKPAHSPETDTKRSASVSTFAAAMAASTVPAAPAWSAQCRSAGFGRVPAQARGKARRSAAAHGGSAMDRLGALHKGNSPMLVRDAPPPSLPPSSSQPSPQASPPPPSPSQTSPPPSYTTSPPPDAASTATRASALRSTGVMPRGTPAGCAAAPDAHAPNDWEQEARLAAGLRWCAARLAGRYKEVGSSEEEALAYLHAHGVRCTAHYRNNVRHFRFPGCSRPLTKDELVPAIEAQKRSGAPPLQPAPPGTAARRTKQPSAEVLAEGLRWCARQLAAAYQGAGDTEGEALAFLRARGVECMAVTSSRVRLFRCPGNAQLMNKGHLAAALVLQRKAPAPNKEARSTRLAEGMHWCALQLLWHYQGVGGDKEAALEFLRSHGVECVSNTNHRRLFRCPASPQPLPVHRLAAVLCLQRKPELVAEEAKRQQDREQGMRWLAERFWNVYQIGGLQPGRATVEDVQAELSKLGVQCTYVGMTSGRPGKEPYITRRFSVPGRIERCTAAGLAKALRLKLLPGCTGLGAPRQSAHDPKVQSRGMLWLATHILSVPSFRRLFGGTTSPHKVCQVLTQLGVSCSPRRTPAGSYTWLFRIKGRAKTIYTRQSLLRALFPGASPA